MLSFESEMKISCIFLALMPSWTQMRPSSFAKATFNAWNVLSTNFVISDSRYFV